MFGDGGGALVDRSTLIVLALLVALLILEFVWLEIRGRGKKRKK
jgi:hypothetical protein